MNFYALLNRFNVFIADAHAARSTQVPPSLSFQILDHDAGQHDHFRVDVVKNLPVREVQAIGDIGRVPCLEGQNGQQELSALEKVK